MIFCPVFWKGNISQIFTQCLKSRLLIDMFENTVSTANLLTANIYYISY